MAAIDPATLPAWPHNDMEAEEATILACLLGRRGKQRSEQPLTGVFGDVIVWWELFRHDRELVELLVKQRTPPTRDDWKGDPVFTTVFTSEIGFVVKTPGFPDTPFLSLQAECQKELVKLFTPGKPALEIADVELVGAMGVLERFKQLATLAREGRQHKQPGKRFKQDAVLPRERLNPGESVYDAIFTIRAHMGIEAAREAFEAWLKDNSNLFTKLNTSVAAQNWQDPRTILSDLGVLRLVRLYGYPGAREWTRKNRPHQRALMPRPEDYESYFVEGKKVKGNRPLYERQREFENAVRRALDAIASL